MTNLTRTGAPTAPLRMRAADVMDRTSTGYRTLDAEAEEIRREARSRFGGFVLDRANPGSRFRNRACQPLDPGLFAEASDLGLLGFALPTEIGGAGRDRFAWGVVIAEVARICRDPGFPVLLDITVENTELVLSSGRPELIERYVPGLAAGRRFGVQGAYESRDPYDYQTTARYQDGEWILNGAKRFLAGAVFADVFVMYVRDEASNDMLAFVVERDDPGVTPVRLESMGLRSMGFGQVVLHDVRLPPWRLVWRSDALSELNTYARNRRMMSACGVLGAMEGTVENCVESLSTRRRSGRRVLDYPNVERSVGEMRALLETSRSMIYRALDATRAPGRDPYFDPLATAAKQQVAEAAQRIGQLVMNLQGGESYLTAFPWEQYMRDILGLIGGQGSQELLLIQLGQRSIVGLEGRLLREEAAVRMVGALSDAWWTLSTLDTPWMSSTVDTRWAPSTVDADERVNASAPTGIGAAVRDVLVAADLAVPPGAEVRGEVATFLDRAHALLAAARAGTLPESLPADLSHLDGAIDGRLGELTTEAWTLVAATVAVRSGLLAQFVQPATVSDAAERAGVAPGLAGELVDVLRSARVLLIHDDGCLVVDPGLERLLIGGPRTAAFVAMLDRAVAGAAYVRTAGGRGPGADRHRAGCGGDAPLLTDLLASALLGRMEGVEELLDRPDVRIGCAAGDGGRSAAALATQIPITPVLALEPDPDAAAARVLAGTAAGAAPVEVRAGDGTGFAASDRLALAWVPAAGLSTAELGRTLTAVGRALVPGGWVVLPVPLAPRRTLGAAVSRLEAALLTGETPAGDAVESALSQAGLTHVRVIWEDAALGLRLVAARRSR
jgi:alkylation response protein AidB-like acyl-CoA dehydrogenase